VAGNLKQAGLRGGGVSHEAGQLAPVVATHKLGVELGRLCSKAAGVAPGSQAYDLKSLRMGTNDIEGLAADRPGRAEYGDTSQRTIHFR
jgi:hypothetical protein